MGNKSLSGQISSISSRLTNCLYPWKYPGISWGFRVELISNQMLNELPKMNKLLDVKLRTRAFCSLKPFSPTAPTKKKFFLASLTCILSVPFVMTSVLRRFYFLGFSVWGCIIEHVFVASRTRAARNSCACKSCQGHPLYLCHGKSESIDGVTFTWISKEVQFMYFWKSNEFHWSKSVGKLQWSRWWCSFRSLGQRLSQRHDCSNSMVRQCRHSGKILAEEDCCQVCSVLGLFRARYNMYVLFFT